MAGQPEIQAEMLTVIGRVYQRLGLHDKAQTLLEQALAAGRRAFGPEHESVARSLNELGVLLYEEGDYAAAVPMLEQALAMRRKLLGDEHKDVAVTLVDLGRAYSALGDLQRAEPMFRESLAIRTKVLGEEDHETGTSLSDLALLLWFRGDLDGAESLYRQSLAIYRKTSGDDHPNVATILSILGGIATDRHNYVTAEPLIRQALAIERRALGGEHFEIASTLNRLSTALRQQGRYGEAESASRDAIRIAKNALGPDHSDVALYELNLARVYLARHDAAAAEPLLRSALRARERSYPAGHWRIGEAKGLLGEALAALARYGEAERLLLDAQSVLHDGSGWEGREAAANRLRLAALREPRSRPKKRLRIVRCPGLRTQRVLGGEGARRTKHDSNCVGERGFDAETARLPDSGKELAMLRPHPLRAPSKAPIAKRLLIVAAALALASLATPALLGTSNRSAPVADTASTGDARAPDRDFDYFPDHYKNQATAPADPVPTF
jgi:tetratricopeptide (TPR) repeat protein